MDVLSRVTGIALVLVVVLAFLRRRTPEIAVQLAVAFVMLVLLALTGPLSQLVGAFGRLASMASIGQPYLDVVLRSVAIAYLAGFGAQLSRDSGEDAIALAIELAGKVTILLLALPVFFALLDTLLRLLPGA